MELTTIFCIKNRPQVQTMNCLESLYKQGGKIILVDYGSSEENLKWERILSSKFNFNLIEVKRDTNVFNKSRALNIGVRHCITKFTMFGDIDNIYRDNFLEVMKKYIRKDRMISCRRFDTTKDGKIIKPSRMAYGGCLVFSTNWLFKVHGFDERYTLWGCEDDDLIRRAIADGLKPKYIPAEKTSCLHQWHPQSNNSSLDTNKYILDCDKSIIRNNLKEWGRL